MEDRKNKIKEEFSCSVRIPDENIELFKTCLIISCEEYPDLSTKKYFDRIAELGEMVNERLTRKDSMYDVLHYLNLILFDVAKLQGNTENYYDPRNSFVNEVIDRGLGIPITLSIIYSEVGKVAGVNIEGVGMAGHFLVKASDGLHEIFVDPFYRGGFLSRKECLKLALRGRSIVDMDTPSLFEKYLPIQNKRSILGRLLNNLKLSYFKQRDYTKSLGAAEKFQILFPGNWRNLGDMARLQIELGLFHQAVESLTDFINNAPKETDTNRAFDYLKQLQKLTGNGGGSNRLKM